MLAHLASVTAQLLALFVGIGVVERRQIGLQRRLGVDHDLLLPGQLDQQIRPLLALRIAECLLLDKVAVLQHAGELDHAPQLNLTPATADGRRAQRPRQVGRLGLQLVLRTGQGAQLRRQLGVVAGAFLLDLAQVGIDAHQGFANRLDDRVDGPLARVQVAGRALLGPFQ